MTPSRVRGVRGIRQPRSMLRGSFFGQLGFRLESRLKFLGLSRSPPGRFGVGWRSWGLHVFGFGYQQKKMHDMKIPISWQVSVSRARTLLYNHHRSILSANY